MNLKAVSMAICGSLLLVHAILASKPQTSAPASQTTRQVIAGEFVIKLDQGVKFEQIRSQKGLSIARIRQRFPLLSEKTGHEYLLVKVTDTGLQQHLQNANFLTKIPGVAAASANTIHHLTRLPNDPLFSQQWGLHNTGQTVFTSQGKEDADIDAPAAWDITNGSPNVVVALLDTGIDINHEDLKANLWKNPSEIPGNNLDDDNNGYVDDYHGFDFAADDDGSNHANPLDIEGHGTHVAGTMAARGNNGIGVAGVCWQAAIMSLKITRPNGDIAFSDELEAFEYILAMKTRFQVNIVVANGSYGGGAENSIESDAIAELAKAGVVVCFAAGNGGDDDIGDDTDISPFYPASYPIENIIAVAASNEQDELTLFSNFGANSVHIAAPGTAIKSTVPMGSGKETSVVYPGGTMLALPLEYSGVTPGIKGALYYCQLGYPQDFPSAVKGEIALIKRGGLYFSDKVKNARAAGAAGVIIFNHSPGNFSGTLGSKNTWLPAIAVSQAYGEELLGLGNIQVTLINRPANYDFMDGTSMATPHVSGAIALMASRFPGEMMDKRISRILLGADRIASLHDKCQSGGRLNIGTLKIQAPLNLQGLQVQNQSFTLSEYINQLTWQANPQNTNIVKYHIYQVDGNNIKLLAEVDVSQKGFMHHRVPRDKNFTYAIQAVDNQDTRGEPALVTIQGL